MKPGSAAVRGAVAAVVLWPAIAWAGDSGLEARIEGLVLVAGWIDKLLLATVLLSALVLVREFSANAELEIPLTKISVPIGSLALCFVVLTVAHGYLTWLYHQQVQFFVNEVSRLHAAPPPGNDRTRCPPVSQEARAIFDEAFVTLTAQGGPLWNGLKKSHVEYSPESGCAESATHLSAGDPPAWLYLGGLAVMALSIVKVYRLGRTLGVRLLYAGAAVVLVLLNWQIGSFWVGSTLALDSENPTRFFLSWPISRLLS